MDELDVYEGGQKGGDPAESAKQRVGAFHHFQIWKSSSPVEDPSRIAASFEQSRRHRWHWPCPHCGHYQEMRFFLHKDGPYIGRGGFAGLKDRHGALLSPELAREQAHYLCEQGCRIDQGDKDEMVRKGRWLADGTRYKKISDKSGERYELVGEAKGPAWHYGIHFPLIATRTFGEAASEYVVAVLNGKLPAFYQRWLSLSWTTRAKRPPWKIFAKNNAGVHCRGIVPAKAWFITAGVDVQEDRVYISIWAWGDRRTSWLIDAFVRERAAGDEADMYKTDLLQAMDLLKLLYPVEGKNALGREQLAIRRMAFDAGHRPDDVHEIVSHYRRNGYRDRVLAVRGDASVKNGARWKLSKIVQNERTKEKYKRPRLEYHLNVHEMKNDESARMLSAIDKPGAMILPHDIASWGKVFLQQMVNEALMIKRGKKVWDAVSPALGVDFWDTRIYARYAAEMFVTRNFGGDWRAESWTAARPEVDHEGIRVR